MKFNKIIAASLCAGMIFSGCGNHATTSSNEEAYEESETVVFDNYESFLQNREYESYFNEEDWYYGLPKAYSIVDIDQNGINELIFMSNALVENNGFENYMVFTADEDTAEVIVVEKPESMKLPNEGVVYQDFGGIRYSPSKKALVINEFRGAPFFLTIHGHEFETVDLDVMDESNYEDAESLETVEI